MWRSYFWFFFFFQAEDGIRDLTVTGVQTCALPISGRGRLFRKADRLRDQAIPRRAGWNGARRGSRDARLRGGRRGAERALENQTPGLLLPGLAVGRSGRHTSAPTRVSPCTGRGPEGFTLTASSVPPPGLLDAHPTGLVAAPATSVSPCRLATPSAFRSATRAASRRWCSRRPTPARSGRTPPRGSTPPGSRRGPAAPATAAPRPTSRRASGRCGECRGRS